MISGPIIVPLTHSQTARQTVEYAVELAGESPVHIVYLLGGHTDTPEGQDELADGEDLLDLATAWIGESIGEESPTIVTNVLGQDHYPHTAKGYATILTKYSEEHGIEDVVYDPNYRIETIESLATPIRERLEESGLRVHSPSRDIIRDEHVTTGRSPAKIYSLFVVSYGFYLLLGDPLYWFDILTGAAVAGIVAITLGNLTWSRDPTFPGSIIRTIRFGLYVPYLIVEIVKANLIISTVILRPSLPIDPKLTRVDTKVGSGLPLLALANSITLTPGTLTVRGNDQRLIIHTLLPAARKDLFGGSLERAVRFVFYGKRYAALPSPEERGDAVILDEVGESE